jgi:PKD repeat protein
MKYIYFIVITLSFNQLFSQDSISVLFIGNSYTTTYDLPNVFKNIANSLGDAVFVDSKTNGGFTFQNHVNDPVTYQKIQSKPWNYVVIQGQSQEPSFPYNQVNSSTLPYAVQLSDSVKSNFICSQVNFFMTWGRQNGDPQWDSINTFDKMNWRLRNAYLRISDSSDASVTPSGIAWKYIRDNFPTINLFSNDGSHPSIAGTYLNACSFYASLFHKSPVGALFPSGIDQATAEILQNTANMIVFDSLGTWKLKHYDSLVQVDFTITELNSNEIQFNMNSEFVTSFYWDFGDGTTSELNNPIHIYNQSGSYDVLLIGSSQCGVDTASYSITINTNSISNQNIEIFQISSEKNKCIRVKSNQANSINSLKLIDLLGRDLDFTITEIKESELILKTESTGIMLIKIETNNSSTAEPIFVFQ